MLAFLTLTAAGTVLAAGAARLPREKQRWILTALAVFFPLSEIVKQLLLTWQAGRYLWWYFPFQLCSMPLYLLPLRQCLPRRFFRLRRILAVFLTDFGLLGGLFVFADQSGMHYDLTVLTVHSYLWHFLLIFLGLFLALSGRSGGSAWEYLPAAGLFVLLAGIAVGIDVACTPLDRLDMFYLNPCLPVEQIFYRDLAKWAGQDAARLAYFASLLLGGFLIHLLAGGAGRLVKKRKMCYHGNGQNRKEKRRKIMKFSQMPYQRPDLTALKEQMKKLTGRLQQAESYSQARAVFLEWEEAGKHLETAATLASVRNSIDTRDAFYDGEIKFWNAAGPELQEYQQAWTAALLKSPYRADFAREYGELMFLNAEMALKTFSPEIIPELQQENELTQTYENLLASAQIPFEGKTYTLSQLTPFKTDPDDARRLAAWQAEGRWYKENQQQLDQLYDQLVHLRDRMGKKLGYEGYTTLGYYRMGRNCYTKEDVERFREAVRRYLVPVADEIYRRQAQRQGKTYPMSFADNALEFRSGNPRPQGSPQEILAQGQRFYRALSPETGVFFDTMLEGELLDVLSTEGKQSGGYCTSLPDYGVPFIFANFNGTQHDVEVVTHEAGHAFAAWMNRDRVPLSSVWPSMEACEVHSMSMEFFAEPWAEGFFGPDAEKFLYSHLSGALTFIPYGTLVDHFQHEVYAHPDMTPRERHQVWKRLLGVYMPWMKLDGEIPFYSEGEGWQRQHHIYSSPFYYIDYCLAQTVSLEFWAMIQEDSKNAWEHYMAYTRQGGSQTFTQLLAHAGLERPFDSACLEKVCRKAREALDHFDLSAVE